MMINSRMIYLAMFLACAGLIALVAAAHNPSVPGRRIYSALLVVMAAIGGGVAIRHVYLEHNPPKIFDCGADVGFMLESFPLTEALPMIFRGTGDCTKVPWRFLGLSIAEWSLICFAILIVAAVLAAIIKRRA